MKGTMGLARGSRRGMVGFPSAGGLTVLLAPIVLTLAPQLLAQSSQTDSASLPAIVSGRVLDAGTGRPVAGAIVMPFGTAAAQVPTEGAPAGPPSRVLTNAGGNFVIRGLHKDRSCCSRRGGYVDAAYAQRRPAGHGQRFPSNQDSGSQMPTSGCGGTASSRERCSTRPANR
jgi:hypothetical protein